MCETVSYFYINTRITFVHFKKSLQEYFKLILTYCMNLCMEFFGEQW